MNHKGATHFTLNDRQTLERMLRKGFSKPAIAEALGKCERSIYYEIGRGLCVQRTTDLIDVEVYCADVAHRKYKAFLKEKGKELKIGHDHALVQRLEELIMVQGFAPGAALAEIRNNGEHFDTEICENTVYNYIYRGDVFLFLTPEHLHDKGRRHYAAKSKRRRPGLPVARASKSARRRSRAGAVLGTGRWTALWGARAPSKPSWC